LGAVFAALFAYFSTKKVDKLFLLAAGSKGAGMRLACPATEGFLDKKEYHKNNGLPV